MSGAAAALAGALIVLAALGYLLCALDRHATRRISEHVDAALAGPDPLGALEDPHPGLVHSWVRCGEIDGVPVDVCSMAGCGTVQVGGRIVTAASA